MKKGNFEPDLNRLFFTVIIPVVSRYLESHRRLVIPQLGAFVVKQPGQVLFSELLKRDDGVLRALLCEAGVGELEAAGEIDRFVFEVRHALEHGAEYPLPGLGYLRPGDNQTIAFVYDPTAQAPEQDAAAAEITRDFACEEPVPAAETQPGAQSCADAESDAESGAAPQGPQFQSEQIVGNAHGASGEFRGSPSAKLNPEPCVKGLRYGKPHKNTNAYTYVGKTSRRWGGDRFLLLAVVAAMLAVAAIAFGYFYSADREQPLPEPIEQSASDQ